MNIKELKFEWDEEKEKSNIRKHGISFVVAAKVFADPGRRKEGLRKWLLKNLH